MSISKEKRFALKILILIVAIGSLIRIFKLTSLPLPPNGDELAYAYYGWSLANYGTDEYGNRFPVYFSSIGDYKYPTLSYLNIIPASIFGLSDITIRFWPAISGVVLIVLTYFLSLLLFGSLKAALLSAFFMAVAPWSITLSRTGHEVLVGNVLSMSAIILLLLASKFKESKENQRKVNKTIFFSLLLFSISLFTYGSQRVFIPAVMAGFAFFAIFTNSRIKNIKKQITFAFIFLSVFTFISLIPWQARGRASGVVWKGPAQEEIDKNIFYDGINVIHTPLLLTRIYHNKITQGLLETSVRYINHFSPNFLFFSGDTSPETTQDLGIVLHVELVFFIFGLLGIWKLKENGFKNIAYMILLAGPTAAAITKGGPHLLRGSNMFPIIALFSGYGLYYFLQGIKKSSWKILLIPVTVLVVLLDSSFALHQIFIHKPVREPWASDQGKKELISEVLSRKDDYKAVAMKEDPYIFFLFYGKISPNDFLKDSEISKESQSSQWERVKKWSNINFGMPFDCPRGGKLNVLYVCKGSEVPQNAKVLKLIKFADGVPAYTLIEFFPISEIQTRKETLPDGMLKYMVERETKFADGIIPDDYPDLW